MQWNFALIMVVLTALTGAIWLIDHWFFAKRRKQLAQKDPVVVEYSKSFFPVILLVLLVRSFLAEPFRIPSDSMMPTLLDGDFILVNKFAYGLRLPVADTKFMDIGAPQRGDVVVFRRPDTGEDYIKRVIGLPGDEVEYRNGVLFVNDERVAVELVGAYAKAQGLFQTASTPTPSRRDGSRAGPAMPAARPGRAGHRPPARARGHPRNLAGAAAGVQRRPAGRMDSRPGRIPDDGRQPQQQPGWPFLGYGARALPGGGDRSREGPAVQPRRDSLQHRRGGRQLRGGPARGARLAPGADRRRHRRGRARERDALLRAEHEDADVLGRGLDHPFEWGPREKALRFARREDAEAARQSIAELYHAWDVAGEYTDAMLGRPNNKADQLAVAVTQEIA